MSKAGFIMLVVILTIGAADGFSQSATPTPRPSVNRMENLRPLDDRDDIDFSRRTSPENLPAEYRISSKADKKTKFTDEEKDFYKNAKKGGVKIVKIFIAPGCADKLTVDVSDSRCAENYDYLPISYYSFFDAVHGQLYSELRIMEDLLIAGKGTMVHGFLLDLGETDIAVLDKKSPPVQKLAGYTIAKTTNAAEKQKTELEKGISFDGEVLSSRKKLLAARSYLLRTVAYAPADASVTPYNYDSIIAFKVDRLTQDGMAIILWKKISEKTAPRLKAED